MRDKRIKSLEKRLQKIEAPSHVIEFACLLYEFSRESNKKELLSYFQKWEELSKEYGGNQLLERRMRNAVHLIGYSETFIFEDMFKLVTILVSIRVLQEMGLETDESLEIKLREATLTCFLQHPKDAQACIHQFRQEWNKDWWYNQLLD